MASGSHVDQHQLRPRFSPKVEELDGAMGEARTRVRGGYSDIAREVKRTEYSGGVPTAAEHP
jgi:hypothetical protein